VKPTDKCLIDIADNFESQKDARKWMDSKLQNLIELNITQRTHYIKEEVTPHTIHYNEEE
jgi:hypothetical protein